MGVYIIARVVHRENTEISINMYTKNKRYIYIYYRFVFEYIYIYIYVYLQLGGGFRDVLLF